MAIKVLFVVVFIGVMVGIGLRQRAKANTVENFVLGGRSINPWMAAFSYGTAYFSGVIFVGNAGQFGWRFGISALWIGIGCAVLGTFLAWVVLGKRTRAMSNHLGSTTMSNFFGSRFGSKPLKLAAALIIFVFLVPYTSSIYTGLSVLFEQAFGVPFLWCAVGMALLTGLYVVLGGYMATAYTDFVQGCIMLVGIVALVATLYANNGGFVNTYHQLSLIPSEVPVTQGQPGAYAGFFGPDPLSMFLVLIMVSLGTWGMPQTIHKFYVIKNSKSIFIGTVVSTLFAFVVAGGCYLVGGFARLYDNPGLYNPEGAIMYDRIIPYMMSTLGDLMMGLVIILVLAASMSTLASLVISSSSTLTLDFVDGGLTKEMTENKKMAWMRVLIVAFIAFSVLLTVWRPTFISQLLSISWGALGGCFIGPLVWSLYSKRTTEASVWCCFVVGIGLTASNTLLGYMPSTNASALAMLLGLVICPVVSLFTKAPDRKLVDEMFRSYETDETMVGANAK